MRMFAYLRPVALLGVLCAAHPLVAQTSTNQVNPTLYEVDLEAVSLHDALLELANELQVSLFFAKESVADLTAKPIQGEFTLDNLFIQLLADACLEYEFIRPELVAISPGCKTPQKTVPTIASKVDTSPLTEPPSQVVEEIIVQEKYITGSRIRNPAFARTMPLDVIDQTEIRLSGYQAVGELLRYVPAVSGNSTSTLISNGGDGTATVTLRGLPASNTLVLLNGRRMNTDALRGGSVDLNTLPLAMVEQIEILKDGVSAIYGSDAIAGVVNVITKQDISGVVLDAYSGQSGYGDLRTHNLSLLFGKQGEHWNASVGLNYYDQSGVFSRDRRLSDSSDDRPRGGIDKRSSATSPSRTGLPDGSVILQDGFSGAQSTDFRDITSEDRFEYRDFTSSIVPSSRSSIFTNVSWDVDEHWQVYFEGLATETQATNFLAPVPLFTGFESIPLIVSANQQFNPFDIDIRDVRRRITELPAREQINDTTTLRGIFGIQRQSNNFNLDFAIQANETQADETFVHGIDSRRVQDALSGNCVSPCVPLNLFGPSGSITSEMLRFIGTGASVSGKSKLFAVTLDTDWVYKNSLFGDIEISSGIEFRQDQLKTRPDEVLLNRALAAGGNRSAISGSRDIFEAYVETYFSLIQDQRFAKILDLQVAARISRYSDFGYEVNPRVVLSWTPITGLTWRGSVAKGFRAPTLLQLHASKIESFEQLNDPCAVAENVASLVGCGQLSDESLTQFPTITGGDSELDPERSNTLSVGVLWQQRLFETDVTFSADWYKIEQEDVVESSAQFIINQNARFGLFGNRVSRNADGNINQVLATLQNIGKREVSGVDLSASLEKDLPRWGRITLAVNATNISMFEDKFDPDSPTIDKAGTFRDQASGGLGGLPDWKVNTGISWQNTSWQGHYNIYYVSNLTEIVPRLNEQRTIDSWTTHNTNVSYVGPYSAGVRVTLGVNNIFDTAPPFSAASFNDSYDGRTYDITGRYYFLKFDTNI